MATSDSSRGPLSAFLTEAGLSQAALARQVNQMGRREYQLDLRYDTASVNRWLRGAVPTAPVPSLIAAILSRRLGRSISIDDLVNPGADTLAFPEAPQEAAARSSALWRDIVRRRELLALPFVSSAGLDAGWRYAFGANTSVPAGLGTTRVGLSDVDRIVAAGADFAALDRRHGGGHARVWLADYLEREALPLLNGSYTDDVGRSLFGAVAYLNQSGAYMALDDGDLAAAQRGFVQGLGLAKLSGDRALGSYILSNMGAQYILVGDGRSGAQMARAGWSTAPRSIPPTLLARLHTTEARGHALAGDARECFEALRRAEEELCRANPDTDPEWIATAATSPAHHAGSIMHCLFDLGRYRDAARHASRALDLPPANTRTRALHEILYARVLAGQGELEQSLHLAGQVMTAASRLRSRRLLGRVHEYRVGIQRHQDVPAVATWMAESQSVLCVTPAQLTGH